MATLATAATVLCGFAEAVAGVGRHPSEVLTVRQQYQESVALLDRISNRRDLGDGRWDPLGGSTAWARKRPALDDWHA